MDAGGVALCDAVYDSFKVSVVGVGALDLGTHVLLGDTIAIYLSNFCMYSATIPNGYIKPIQKQRPLNPYFTIVYNKKGGSLLFEVLLHAEVKAIILLKLQDLLQSLPLDELPHSPAVGNLQQVRLEIIVSESKVEELFRIVLHLL